MPDIITLPAGMGVSPTAPRKVKADGVMLGSDRAPETKAAVQFLLSLDQIIMDAERLHAMIR